MTEYVCSECREAISPDATTCPHCGATGDQPGGALGVFVFLLGGLFTITVIGAIIGVPMMWWGAKRAKRSNETSPAIEV